MYKTIDYIIYPVEIAVLASEYEGVFSRKSIIRMHESGLRPFEIKEMIEFYLHTYQYTRHSEDDFLCMLLNIHPITTYNVERHLKEDTDKTKCEVVPNSKAYRIQNKNKRHY